MSTKEQLLDNDLFASLLDIGYMCVNIGLVDHADQILRSLTYLKSDRIEPFLGMALLVWRTQGTEATLNFMQELRETHGEVPSLLAMLAMVYAANDRHDEALSIVRPLMNNEDESVRTYARNFVRELANARSEIAA